MANLALAGPRCDLPNLRVASSIQVMPALQWCQHCARVWLDPLWDFESVAPIPKRCVRRGCEVRVRLFDSDLLGLRRTLHQWALSEGFEKTAPQTLLRQFDGAIGFAKRQGERRVRDASPATRPRTSG